LLSQKPIQSRHEFLVGASRSGKTTFLISQILEDLERVERGECSVIVMDIPVHDHSGTLLAYCGRTVKDESPALLFPNGFNPASAIFNAHRITKGELYLVRDPVYRKLKLGRSDGEARRGSGVNE